MCCSGNPKISNSASASGSSDRSFCYKLTTPSAVIPHSRQTKCQKRATTLSSLVKPSNAAKSITSTSAVDPQTHTPLRENVCPEPPPPPAVPIKQLYHGSVKPSFQDQA